MADVQAATLNQFISEVRTRGLANPNKFFVTITIPSSVPADNDALRLVGIFCDQAQLPDQTVSTAQVRTYGEIREVPYENLYGNVSLSFYVDSDYITKIFFDLWIQSISNTETRHWEYYDNFISPSIEITMYNNDGARVYGAILYECYPKTLQAITLDAGSKDAMKFSVSMNYKYWRPVKYSEAVAASPQLPGLPSGPMSDINSMVSGLDGLTILNPLSSNGMVTLTGGGVEANMPNTNGAVQSAVTSAKSLLGGIEDKINGAISTATNKILGDTEKAKNARDAMGKLLSALPVSGRIQDVRGKASGMIEQVERGTELLNKIGGFF